MSKLFPAPAEIPEFRTALLNWFDQNRRDLPWRRSKDPYAIWVSEIMLQQTRVAAVLVHYANWMRRFPTVQQLAAASEHEVLAAWSGLGYYRRARSLHRGAQTVVDEYQGKLSPTAIELRKLPGIGAYTAAAIASIAFNQPVAAVDGNVERVLLRQAGGGETGPQKKPRNNLKQTWLKARDIQRLATALIDPDRAGDFNQAMMELGATVCLPRNPLCLHCPVRASCRTRGAHPTTARKATQIVDICYGLLTRESEGSTQVLLQQRHPTATVMPGMWELPRLDSASTAETKPMVALRHAIMQTNYRVAVYPLPLAHRSAVESPEENQRWIEVADLMRLPLTGLARKIFLRVRLLLRG